MPKNLFLFLSLILSFQFSKAQTQSANSLEFSPQISFATFTDGRKLTGTAYGAEFLYHINTENNPKAWMRSLNLKSIDLVYNYKNMGNIKILNDPREAMFGDSHAVLGALSILLLKAKQTEFLFSPALGLSYVSKTFFTNQNPLIGSRINFAVRGALKITTPITSSTSLSAGIDLLHHSSASLRIPNKGMNTVNLGIGIIHSLSPYPKHIDTTNAKSEYKKYSFDFGVNIGRRGDYQSKGGHFKTGLNAYYNYRLGNAIGISGGVDAVYYHSVYDSLNNAYAKQLFANSYDHWRVGLAVGPDFWMGKLALMLKYGYYLHYNSVRHTNTYWTTGLRYDVKNWVALQGKAYIHKVEADYIGFGFIFTP
ncbi:MAG: acyloxyacyl hydrolase [Bacteroidota bacterium]